MDVCGGGTSRWRESGKSSAFGASDFPQEEKNVEESWGFHTSSLYVSI